MSPFAWLNQLRQRNERIRKRALSRARNAHRRPGRALLSKLSGEFLESRLLLASDFGDAPLPYPVTLAEGGPEHMDTGPTLGATRDTEADGVHSLGADADDTTGSDDEDGVTIPTMRAGEVGVEITVNAQNTGGAAALSAWIDFNGDGSFGGPGELIARGMAMSEGDNTVIVDVPSNAFIGTVYARFRIVASGFLGPTGTSSNGEVEDYAVTIDPPLLASVTFGEAQRVVTDNGANSGTVLSTADIDRDGDIDTVAIFPVTCCGGGANLGWQENDGNGSFTNNFLSGGSSKKTDGFAVDFDGDGDIDVVEGYSQTNNEINWFRNNGSQTFTHLLFRDLGGSNAVDVPIYPVDIDRDGAMEVLTWNDNTNKIEWYNGPGGAANEVGFGSLSPVFLAAADINNDGHMDVLSVTPAFDSVDWYPNDGSNNFVSVQEISFNVADSPEQIFSADVNSDGNMDVVVVSSNDDKVAWYENDGSENFTERIISTSADGAKAVYAADIDGDGDVDVMSASVNDNKVAVYINDGSENFTEQVITTSANAPDSIFAADVDGDGGLDVIARDVWYKNLISIVSITPVDTVKAEGDSGTTTLTFEVTRQDTRGPLTLDFAVTPSGIDPAEAGDFDGAAFPSGMVMFGDTVGTVMLNIDVAGDTDVEADEGFTVTLTDPAGLVDFVQDTADGTILADDDIDAGDAPAPYPTLIADLGGRHLATGPTLGTNRDVDADGQPTATADGDDLNGGPDDEDGVSVVPVQAGAVDESFTVNVSANAVLDAWIDFNADGSWNGPFERVADNLPVNAGNNTLMFDVPSWAIIGTTFARFRVSTAGVASPTAFSVDGEVEDYQVTITGPDSTSAVFNTEQLISDIDGGPRDVAAIDLDGDGDVDVLVGGQEYYDGKVAWFENVGNDNFSRHEIFTEAAESLFPVDLDGDGDLDVLLGEPTAGYYGGTARLWWLENDGSQSFTQHFVTTIQNSTSHVPVFPADIDGDGDLDFIAPATSGYYTPIRLAWYENDGSENFTPHQIGATTNLRDVFAADIDGDGDIDVASARNRSRGGQ